MIEELYDTEKDPDNTNNLANRPEYKSKIESMKRSLADWQSEIFDAGLLPEGERYRRSQENGLTIYEMVRKPKLYDLKTYVNCSDVALMKDVTNAEEMSQWVSSNDSGVRYWGILGLHLLGDSVGEHKEAVLKGLKDQNDDVKALSAWSAFHLGEKSKAVKAWSEILSRKSMTNLAVLNFVELTGLVDSSLLRAIEGIQKTEMLGNYEERLQQFLIERMKP